MIRFIGLLFLFITSLYSSLVNNSYLGNDIKILQDLDIPSTYITDYKLQKELQTRLKTTKRYTQKLNDAYLFIPQIKKILQQNDIPDAFLYMAMAESEFVLDAYSKKKAKGLWQFMPQTATFYGLQTNRYVDERMDIVKSTQAAVKYLKRLHNLFGKWYLAAIAYNCGEGRVIEGITRATIDMYCEDVGYKQCRRDKKILKFRQTIKLYQQKKVKFRAIGKIYKEIKKWKYKPNIDKLLLIQSVTKRQYIPNESRGYLRKIIALALMNNNDFLLANNHSHLLNRSLTDPIAKIEVNGGVFLSDIAKTLHLDLQKLKNLNLHIKKAFLPYPNKRYTLYIPYSKLIVFNANKDNIKSTSIAVYRVKAGDTLGKIARKYALDYKTIQQYNHLQSSIIRVGQELTIPLGGKSDITDHKKVEMIKKYIVKSGDTLGKIAYLYKTKVEKLQKDNNLKTTKIKVGDELVIKN